MLPLRRWHAAALVFPSLLACADAFYLPGAAPHDYHEGDTVSLFVNALTPMLAGNNSAKIVSRETVSYAQLTLSVCVEIDDKL